MSTKVHNVIYVSYLKALIFLADVDIYRGPNLLGNMEKMKVLLFSFILTGLQEAVAFDYCNNSLYSSISNGNPRHTVIKDGDFTLQALFSQTTGSSCTTPSNDGVVNVAVLQLAVQHVARSNILPGFKLGYQIDNGCTDIPRVMKRGIEIVSMYRPNSVCRADFIDCKSNTTGVGVKPISAVVGPGYSFLTIPLASLMGLYNIPHISYQASSRLLSKRELYKSFFRTIPSDSNQVLVMLDIMKKFNWNYLFAIGSDDDYGKLGVSALKEQASAHNICIAFDAYIPNSGNKVQTKVDEIIKKMIETPKAQLIVLFTYASMGELILREAEKKNIHRIWLTSDAWASAGPKINVSEKYLSGIITVATEKVVIPGLQSYLEYTIQKEPLCNPWLSSFLKTAYKCSFDKQTTSCPGETAKTIAKKMLSYNSGGFANLYDAVFAVAHSISSMLQKKCGYKSGAYNRTLCYPFSPSELLAQIANVSFIGLFSRPVEFDANGDPKMPHYIIENIQKKDGKLKYVQVGTWEKLGATTSGDNLVLNTSNIVWPQQYTSVPDSKCSVDCMPGQYVHAKTECCWSCQECEPLHVSNVVNAASCLKCPPQHHTDKKNTMCIKTPIVYLTASTGAGIAILTVSCIGLFIMVILAILFFHLRHSHMIKESQPAIIGFSIPVLFFCFAYGILHVIKPNDNFCSGRSSYFFMLFGTVSGVLFASTGFVQKTLKNWFNKFLAVNVTIVQYIVIALIMLMELICIVIWLEIDPVKMESFPNSEKTELFLECRVELTLTRLICMGLPCIVLIIAMIIAFRERNTNHPYNEPKFLSFATIALSIIVVAFIPTFKFVVGVYKSIVMAFTVDLCAYTYISCMFVPKIYALITQCYGHANVSGGSSVNADNACSIHEVTRAEVPKNGQSDSSDNTSTPRAKYVQKDPTATDIQLLQRDSKLTSLPPSPQSDTKGSPHRKASDAGSGSQLMISGATYV